MWGWKRTFLDKEKKHQSNFYETNGGNWTLTEYDIKKLVLISGVG